MLETPRAPKFEARMAVTHSRYSFVCRLAWEPGVTQMLRVCCRGLLPQSTLQRCLEHVIAQSHNTAATNLLTRLLHTKMIPMEFVVAHSSGIIKVFTEHNLSHRGGYAGGLTLLLLSR